MHDKPLGQNCTIIFFCSRFIYLFCKGMKAQIAGEHLKDLLTSGKVLNIGYGKVCNSKLIALQLC